MMYEIIFSDNAVKELKKLDSTTKQRIINALERIRIRPEQYVQRLVAVQGYKLRIGDYRVLLDIQNKQMLFFVIKIAHRKNVYERL